MPEIDLPEANDVQTLLDELRRTIEGLNTARERLGDDHAKAMKKLAERESRVDALVERLDTQVARAKTASADLSGVEKRTKALVTAVKKDLARVEASTGAVAGNVANELEKRFLTATGKLTGTVTAMTTRVSGVEQQIATVKAESRQTQVSAERAVAELKRELSAVGSRGERQVSSVNGKFAGLAADVEELREEMSKPGWKKLF